MLLLVKRLLKKAAVETKLDWILIIKSLRDFVAVDQQTAPLEADDYLEGHGAKCKSPQEDADYYLHLEAKLIGIVHLTSEVVQEVAAVEASGLLMMSDLPKRIADDERH